MEELCTMQSDRLVRIKQKKMAFVWRLKKAHMKWVADIDKLLTRKEKPMQMTIFVSFMFDFLLTDEDWSWLLWSPSLSDKNSTNKVNFDKYFIRTLVG